MFRPQIPPFSTCFKLNLAATRRILVQRKNTEQHGKKRKGKGKRGENEVFIAARKFSAVRSQLKRELSSSGSPLYSLKLFPGSFQKRMQIANNGFYTKKTENN